MEKVHMKTTTRLLRSVNTNRSTETNHRIAIHCSSPLKNPMIAVLTNGTWAKAAAAAAQTKVNLVNLTALLLEQHSPSSQLRSVVHKELSVNHHC